MTDWTDDDFNALARRTMENTEAIKHLAAEVKTLTANVDKLADNVDRVTQSLGELSPMLVEILRRLPPEQNP